MQDINNNMLALTGAADTEPEYSHTVYGEDFYSLYVGVPRLSGAVDRLPVTVSARALPASLAIGDTVALTGQLRSYNRTVDGVGRLMITAFARTFELAPYAEPLNEVSIDGFICKPVVYRTTPFSREIADLLVAVNRSYNKSDYLPCIAWGRNARFADSLPLGARVLITGRVQSREYRKATAADEYETRTAYEISASSLLVSDV